MSEDLRESLATLRRLVIVVRVGQDMVDHPQIDRIQLRNLEDSDPSAPFMKDSNPIQDAYLR